MQMIITVFTSVHNAHKDILLSYNKPDKYSIKNMSLNKSQGCLRPQCVAYLRHNHHISHQTNTQKDI